MPIANARMYAATPAARADWRAVLEWTLRTAELDWEIIDYDAPAPLNALWARDDLGATMMCGLPFAKRLPRPMLIAAPVPSPPRYGGRPIYFTDLVVRADSSFRRLEDTFGGVVGYTLPDSMSGCQAMLRHLRGSSGDRVRPYRCAVGGLLNARGVIDALSAHRIDVGPLDSWYHDLLRRNDPAFAARVRTIEVTASAPIPPLVATATLDVDQVARLRRALLACNRAPELADALDRLLLKGFAVPPDVDYDALGGLRQRIEDFVEE